MLRKIKPNNRTAKRFRGSAGRTNVLDKQLFQRYKELYPKSSIDFKQFKLIIKTTHDLILDTIITNRDGFQFPHQLGFMFVGSYRPKTKPVDRKKTLELGYEVRHNNFETDGLACKIFYSNYASRYKNTVSKYYNKVVSRQLWKFVPHRTVKNNVSKAYKQNYKLYKQINPGDNAWKKLIQ